MNLNQFKSKFAFRPELHGFIGIEREFFITDKDGLLVPKAELLLNSLNNPLYGAGSFSYELSACQIESQSIPCWNNHEIKETQKKLDVELDKATKALNLNKICLEVAPEDMDLTVFPDPKKRYQEIAKILSPEALNAACRVTGTHFHIGMSNAEVALETYNRVIEHHDMLCEMGDKSSGERLRLYKVVTPDNRPTEYNSWEDFHAKAIQNGFEENPRDCWAMIRLTIHGTLEFKNFGVTSSIDEIIEWANFCRSICL